MKKYILSIDQGTTSTRAIIFDRSSIALFMAQREVKCYYPKPGWVESDALEIWVSVIDVINEVLVKANLTMKDIDSIGITNQRETVVVWDKKSGLPVYHAIIWQSRQSKYICDSLEDKKQFIHQKTGLLINPYFSASKIRFILDNIENGQQRAENNELMVGTIDTWIMYKMSHGNIYATDVTNASRTLLYNIFDHCWDEELCKLFNIPISMLCKVNPSSYKYGRASFFSNDVYICGVAGDQQAALFGQTCFSKGEFKNTYGTGCFMLTNIGNKPLLSQKGLLTTIAWQIGDEFTYALEGSIFIGGALVQWLRDEMNLISSAAESEEFANKCQDSNGVYIVPAFVGLGAPYWQDDAKGAVFGLTRGTNKYQFVKACLEAIAYQCKDVIDVIKKEANIDIKSLKVDGGATNNNYLMQFQSDILHTNIILPKCVETTALGVSYLSGLASGYYKSLQDINSCYCKNKEFHPQMSIKKAKSIYRGWKRAVRATITFKSK